MQPVLFDTSVYIAALRAKDDVALRLRRISGSVSVWLSSLVLEELYAGANSHSRRAVERLEHDFDKAGRILVPNLGDWTQTGDVLARLASRFGYERIGQDRLTNDAPIAMSAGALGITVITAHARDFSKLAEFRPVRWRMAQ
jgi:predicted nucleic acid-binding protein